MQAEVGALLLFEGCIADKILDLKKLRWGQIEKVILWRD